MGKMNLLFTYMIVAIASRASSGGKLFKHQDQLPQLGEVELIYQNTLGTGEGPHWVVEESVLYFIDIPGHSIFHYDPSTGITTSAQVLEAGTVSFIIPVEGRPNTFMVGVDQQVGTVEWDGTDGQSLTFSRVAAVAEHAGNRFNDAKCDRRGRLWPGTMGYYSEGVGIAMYLSNLYKLRSDNVLEVQITNISLSNGMAWSADDSLFYYIDTLEKRVDVLDYDIEAGTIRNRRTFFDLRQNGFAEASPDGMTIDVEGNLWVALYEGHGVVKVNGTTGIPEGFISLPVSKITSCGWGGENLDVLYVTTAAEGVNLDEYPLSGSTFKVTGLQTSGFPSQSIVLE